MKKRGNPKKRSKKIKAHIKNNSKRTAQRKHAVQRAKDRHNIDLTPEDFTKIKDMIESGLSELLEKQSHRVSIRKITLNNKEYVIVYDHNRKTVVSFLPKDNWFTGTPLDIQQPPS